jgi:Uma2 family endonuclease
MTPATDTRREPAPAKQVPALQTGDRLTRAEFERRYEAMPEATRAELIEGVVYIMPSPVANEEHGVPHFQAIAWLGLYNAFTPGTQGGDNSTLRLDLDNEPQPDAYLRILPEYGGQSRTSNDKKRYVVGAPELILEVAASSVSYDLHDKLNAYRRNGVLEYVVWRVLDEEVDWFVLRDGRYERQMLNAEGHYESATFPGLWLDAQALLRGDLGRVMQVLQQGIARPEHAAFVERLHQHAHR